MCMYMNDFIALELMQEVYMRDRGIITSSKINVAHTPVLAAQNLKSISLKKLGKSHAFC